MAIGYNPKTITNGLVLCIDAANSKSYSGSGTSISDISGKGNSGTLSNGPTFSSNNNGYWVFDGIDDYILSNNTSLASQFSSLSVSHFTWFYPTGAGQIVSELGQTTINSSWHDTNVEISSAGAFSFSTWHGGLTSRVTSSNQSYNQWYQIGFTYNGTTLTAYINGQSIGTTAFTRDAPYNNAYALHYALCALDSTNMGTYGHAAGRLASFSVYNRALSAYEVNQNFLALRGRFGM